jgi:hypothetical protein
MRALIRFVREYPTTVLLAGPVFFQVYVLIDVIRDKWKGKRG